MSITPKYRLPSTLISAPLRSEPPISHFLQPLSTLPVLQQQSAFDEQHSLRSKQEQILYLTKDLEIAKGKMDRYFRMCQSYKLSKEKGDSIIQEQNKTISQLREEIEMLILNKKKNFYVQNENKSSESADLKHKNQIFELKQQHRSLLEEQRMKLKSQNKKSSLIEKEKIQELHKDLMIVQMEKLQLLEKMQTLKNDNHQRTIRLQSEISKLKCDLDETRNQLDNQVNMFRNNKSHFQFRQAQLQAEVQNLREINQNIEKKFKEELNSAMLEKDKRKDLIVQKEVKELNVKHKQQISKHLRQQNSLIIKLKQLKTMCSNLQHTIKKEKEEKKVLQAELNKALLDYHAQMKIVGSQHRSELESQYLSFSNKLEANGSGEKIEIIDRLGKDTIEKQVPLEKVIINFSEVMKVKEKDKEGMEVQNKQLKKKIQVLMEKIAVQQDAFEAKWQNYEQQIRQAESNANNIFLQMESDFNSVLNNRIHMIKEDYEIEKSALTKENIQLKSLMRKEGGGSIKQFQMMSKENKITDLLKVIQKMKLEGNKMKESIEGMKHQIKRLNQKIQSSRLQKQMEMIELQAKEEKEMKDNLEKIKIESEHSQGMESFKSQFEQLSHPKIFEGVDNKNDYFEDRLAISKKEKKSTIKEIIQIQGYILNDQAQQTEYQEDFARHQQELDQIISLKELQNSRILKEVKDLMEEHHSLQNQFNEYSERLNEEKKELIRQNKEISLRIQEMNIELEKLRLKIHQQEQEKSKLERIISLKEEEIKNCKDQQKHLTQKQHQIVLLQNEIRAKTELIHTVSNQSLKIKLALRQAQKKSSEAVSDFESNKFTKQVVYAQKQLIESLKYEVSQSDRRIRKIAQNQTHMSASFNERMLFLENLQAQLGKTTEFKNSIDFELRTKIKQNQKLQRLLEEKDSQYRVEKEQYNLRISTLEKNASKAIQNYSGEDSQQRQILFKEIDHLRTCIDLRSDTYEKEINRLRQQHELQSNRYLVQIQQLKGLLSKMRYEYFKIKAEYDTSITKLQKFNKKYRKVFDRIKNVQEEIQQDLASSLLKESQALQQEGHISQLSHSFDKMENIQTMAQKKQIETTFRNEDHYLSTKNVSPLNSNQIVSEFNGAFGLATSTPVMPMTPPKPRSK